MADTVTIKEFVATLGYKVDEASQRKFTDALTGIQKTAEGLGLGLLALTERLATAVADSAKQMAGLSLSVQGINTGLKGSETAEGLSDLAGALEKIAGISPDRTIGVLKGMAEALKGVDGQRLKAAWEQEQFGGKGTLEQQILHFRERLLSPEIANNPALRANMIARFQQLLPPDFINSLLFSGVPEAFKEQGARRERGGINLTDLTKAADEQRKTLFDINKDLETMRNMVFREFSPVINEELKKFQKWMDESLPSISDKMKEFGEWFKNAPEPIKQTAAAIYLLSGNLGGLKDILEALGALAIVKWLIGGRAAVAGVGAAAAGAAAPIVAGATTFGGAGSGLGVGVMFEEIMKWRKDNPALVAKSDKAIKELGDQIDNWVMGKLHSIGQWFGSGQKDDQRQGVTPTSPGGIPGVGPMFGAQQSPTGPGFLQRMWKGFWDSIVGTAHADELPSNVKQLSQNTYDLNRTISDWLDQTTLGSLAQGGLGSEHLPGFGGGSTPGIAPKNANTGKKVDVNDPKVAHAMDVLMGGGYSREDAAAIVGNLMMESGLDPTAYNKQGGGQGHRGIAQWGGTRLQSFRLLMGKDVSEASVDEQLKFVMWELANTHKKAAEAMRTAIGEDAKVAAIWGKYEIPGVTDPSLPARQGIGRALTSGTHNYGGDRNLNINHTVTNNVSGMNAEEISRTLKHQQEHDLAEHSRYVQGNYN